MSAGPGPENPIVSVADPIPVDLASVESVLTRLWRHEPTGPDSSQGVLTRACMSNLIIVCRGKEQAGVLTREVDTIVSRHPSRVLLLVADARGPGLSSAIEAAVSAHCHFGGDHRQICSEMVTIGAGGDEVRKLPSAARSLLVGDLPTSLWWDANDPPPLGGRLFEELSRMANQVIYSSRGWDDPVRGTLATADWVAHARPGDAVAVDLEWRGLRPWRQLISQSLDPTAVPGAIEALVDVEIDHGPHGLPQSWLLAGWLASALDWKATERTVVKGHEMSWRFQAGRNEVGLVVKRVEGEPQVVRVKTTWRADGRKAALTFASAGPGHLGASAEGLDAETRVLAAPPTSRALLVAAELEQLEPDLVFREALRVSRVLAENLVLS